jgi:hydroxymethylglutaryl-CoA synthase
MIAQQTYKTMTHIIGFGTYLPYYRLKLEEIAKAWNRGGGRGEKTVSGHDEDIVTMGVKAGARALDHARISSDKIGAIYVCSLSSGFGENSIAAQVAYALGITGDVGCSDLGLSARVVTSSLQACSDAIEAKRIQFGLIIASDALRAKPGSDAELASAAGAAALVIGSKSGIASIMGFGSHTTSFISHYSLADQSRLIDDERFIVKHGYLEHLARATKALESSKKISLSEISKIVLQAPDPKWPARALSKLGFKPEQLISLGAQTGYAGCASFLIDLAAACEQAKPNEKILAISFGPGGSDAFLLIVNENKPSPNSVGAQLAEKEYLNYTTYLRYTKHL